ncbi:MAG: hypothetical protein JWM99_4133 [Verrucomicrobiales bacterium]|nr:hypothetical protein [Verrucomicrobiales bacterium]
MRCKGLEGHKRPQGLKGELDWRRNRGTDRGGQVLGGTLRNLARYSAAAHGEGA